MAVSSASLRRLFPFSLSHSCFPLFYFFFFFFFFFYYYFFFSFSLSNPF